MSLKIWRAILPRGVWAVETEFCQGGRQVGARGLLRAPVLRMGRQRGQRRSERWPGRSDTVSVVRAGIPGPPEAGEGLCRGIGHAVQVAREKGVELVVVRRLRLRVDLPHEGSRRPLRTHEGILTAHEIQVARPQQLVVADLVGEGQHLHRETAAFDTIPRL